VSQSRLQPVTATAIGLLLAFGLHTQLTSGDDEEQRITHLAPDAGFVGALNPGVSTGLDELTIGLA
jgi:hypothetical protein